ncbi:22587_t:CDS:2 [Gigaspora rosea]|nr:22587_t:CDS:2 [Gigaspora rosea]
MPVSKNTKSHIGLVLQRWYLDEFNESNPTIVDMKVLNLAIIMNKSEEIYKIHEKFVREIEKEIESQDGYTAKKNALEENAKAKIPRIDQRNNDNDILVGHNARMCKNITEFSDSEIEETSSIEEPKINKRKCRICESEGYNARTCSG